MVRGKSLAKYGDSQRPRPIHGDEERDDMKASEIIKTVEHRVYGNTTITMAENCTPSGLAKYEVSVGANWFCYCQSKHDAALIVDMLRYFKNAQAELSRRAKVEEPTAKAEAVKSCVNCGQKAASECLPVTPDRLCGEDNGYFKWTPNPPDRAEIEPWLCLPSESLTRNEVDAMFQQLQRRVEAAERRGK